MEWTWNAGAPGRRSTSVTIPTIGTLSSSASPIPVRQFVIPGPGTTLKTPTPPVTRAEASAMTLAEASLVTSRYGIPADFIASQNSLFWAPGTPKTQGTRSQQSAATAAWAPVSRPRTPEPPGLTNTGGRSPPSACDAAEATAPIAPSARIASRRFSSTAALPGDRTIGARSRHVVEALRFLRARLNSISSCLSDRKLGRADPAERAGIRRSIEDYRSNPTIRRNREWNSSVKNSGFSRRCRMHSRTIGPR